MDLEFNFSDEDFDETFNNKAAAQDNIPYYEARFDTPEWFLKSNLEENPKLKLNALKFRGDYFYAQGEYDKSIPEYLAILKLMNEGAKSSIPLKREVFESLSRSYLKMECYEKALKYTHLFHSTSNPVNSCNLFASFDLLSRVYSLLGTHPRTTMYCIIQMLIHRPFTPRAWNLLGDSYEGDSPLKSVASWLRAIGLYESVSKTVGSIVREQNQRSIEEVQRKVDSCQLESRVVKDLRRIMTRDLVNEVSEKSIECGAVEFTDLGASKRMKPIEEGYRSPENAEDLQMDWNSVADFEKKWFSAT